MAIQIYWPVFVLNFVVVTCSVQQDPTKVCLPATYQSNYTNILTGDTGYVVVNFTKELFTEVSTASGLRLILDFKNLKSYEIKNSRCREAKLPPSRVQTRCLPSYAKLMPTQTGNIGNVQTINGSIYVQTWEVQTAFDIVFRETYSVQGGQTYWLVMSQELSYHGTNSVNLYTDPKADVTDMAAFNIPASCESEDFGPPLFMG